MSFIHQDPEIRDLLLIVADEAGIDPALVEKDYWVTQSLWALREAELEVWFKGGTSLSKGFGIIQRFSEDLDLRLEPGSAAGVAQVKSWKSVNRGPVAQRKAFFESLEKAVTVPDARLELERASLDKRARGASYRVLYPGLFLDDLGPQIRPFVLLEVGVARVTPHVERTLSSFVHDWLEQAGKLREYADTRPVVRCVHPLVTLLEKIDAISRRYAREPLDPDSFIRHYEDAARIVRSLSELPALGVDAAALAAEMFRERQIARAPSADDPAFVLADPAKRRELLRTHASIAPMFWGERYSLEDACAILREWMADSF